MATQIRIAQDEAADEVLSNDPFALLVGMLLDQQVPMEKAFHSPYDLKQRLESRGELERLLFGVLGLTHKERGHLGLLKGLVTIEGSCSLPNSGLKAEDFDNIPYLALKGDYTATSPTCRDTVADISTLGKGTTVNVRLPI